MTITTRSILTIVVLALTTHLVQADRVTIVKIDGTELTGQWQSAKPDLITITQNKKTTTLQLADIHKVRFTHRPSPPNPDYLTEFYPAAGGKLMGRITGSADIAVVAETTIADQLTIPFDKLAALWFDNSKTHRDTREQFDQLRQNRLAGKDVLIALRNDTPTTIKCGILSLDTTGGRLIFNGNERTFSTKNVPAVVFAVGLATQQRWPMTATLTDGTVMPGKMTSSNDESLTFDTAIGQSITLPLYRVATLQFKSPRVVYLSDLTPTEQSSAGKLLDPIPPRFDRNAANGPIALAGQSYDKGIGTHANTEITYTLDQPCETFAATIGIDDSVRPGGYVVFKILGDGRILYESDSVTGTNNPRPIAVNIRGIGKLTLITDLAEQLDISDLANWADARLITPGETP